MVREKSLMLSTWKISQKGNPKKKKKPTKNLAHDRTKGKLSFLSEPQLIVQTTHNTQATQAVCRTEIQEKHL